MTDFARRYGDRLHQTTHLVLTPSQLPSLIEVEDMTKKARLQVNYLSEIREVVIAQQAAYDQQAAERWQRQQQTAHAEPIMSTMQYVDDIKRGFAGSTRKKRSAAQHPERCLSCNRMNTPEWRRGPNGARTLCNACGLHYAKLTRKSKNSYKSPASSGTPADGNRGNGSGIGTAGNPSSAGDDTVMDENGSQGSGPAADALSENAGYLPLSSRTSAAIFRGAQTGLERLFVDLQSFDDGDTKDDLVVTSGSDSESHHSTPLSSSEVSEPEDTGDGDGNGSRPKGSQAGSQAASGGTSQGTGADDQEHSVSSRKRQRVEDGSDDYSRTTAKTKRKKPVSDKEQRLVCCFRDDSLTPCSGTDKSICEVIERLATSHNTFICKTYYTSLTESDSGEKVHPAGVDCIEQCLSPRCLEGRLTTVDQKHRFDTKSCGTKTGRPRPEDRESIYRYIFKLVHPAKEVPADVFTTEKTPHWDMIPRQGNRKATRDELESRVRKLSEELDELSKRDSASTRQIDVLTRNLETERTNNAYLAEKMQRLRDIIADSIRPGALNDDHRRRSILQRVKVDAPSALDVFGRLPAHVQTLQTPPESLHNTCSQKSHTLPTLDEAGLTGQDQLSRDSNLQLPSNNTARHQASSSIPDGDFLARFVLPEYMRHSMPNRSPGPSYDDHRFMRGTILHPPYGPFVANTTESTPPQDLSGSLGQWRQDTPSGGVLGFSDFSINTDVQNGARTVLPPPIASEEQAWTEDMWDGYLGVPGQ
jgi:hypothetical protein